MRERGLWSGPAGGGVVIVADARNQLRRHLLRHRRQYIVQIIDAPLIIQNTLQDSVVLAGHAIADNRNVVQKYILQKPPICII